MSHNDPQAGPGDPYPFQGSAPNPFLEQVKSWQPRIKQELADARDVDTAAPTDPFAMTHEEALHAGTTSIQAADAEGWVVSITPSGGWIPAFIAGETGVGLSQRMQSFVMDASQNPYNVMAPGKRPRATLTPGLAMRNGKPFMAFGVQGGDTQDQNLLQYFLNIVEFGMDPQEASEAANFNSYQLHSSFGERVTEPGKLLLRADMPYEIQARLASMGYTIEVQKQTSGPITGIYFDQEQGTMVGGASDFGDDYGIAW